MYGHPPSAAPRGLSEAGLLAVAQAQWRERAIKKRHRKSTTSSQLQYLQSQRPQPQPKQPQVSDIPCISLLSPFLLKQGISLPLSLILLLLLQQDLKHSPDFYFQFGMKTSACRIKLNMIQL